jgi:hypothetical protein
MTRRLFFLLPDEAQAVQFLSDLENAGIERRHLHAIAGRGRDVSRLAPASMRQRHDWVGRIERVVWAGNLLLFALAGIGLILALVSAQPVWAVVASGVMLAAFAGGTWFTQRIPTTNLAEFQELLKHDEILMLVDVPKARVGEIEDLVRRRHPEAIAGGVGWTVEALGL